MLSLVFILCVTEIIFSIRKWKKHKKLYCIVISNICIILGIVTITAIIAVFGVFVKNDTEYLQSQIDNLTEVNIQMENWIKITEDKLSDNPELLNYVKGYFNKEVAFNNEEIDKCKRLKENTIPRCRWLLYFG